MKKKRKMTIKEYAKERDIDLKRHFIDEDLNMPMQSYLKKIGLPNGAEVFRILYNEKV